MVAGTGDSKGPSRSKDSYSALWVHGTVAAVPSLLCLPVFAVEGRRERRCRRSEIFVPNDGMALKNLRIFWPKMLARKGRQADMIAALGSTYVQIEARKWDPGRRSLLVSFQFYLAM